jgi:O-antigen/teichoic acid export membrane protein
MDFGKYFSNTNNRTTRALKNIGSLFIIKSFSIVINLALVPLTINYLSPLKYGIWLTISSMVGWISFFDIGLGHGLRNKLAEAIAKNETEKAKSYVSTAYISISLLCVLLFLFFIALNSFLDWNRLLNIPNEMNENLKTIAFVLFTTFLMQFVLQLINSIMLGTQQTAKVSLFNLISNVFVLLGIFLLTKFAKESLLNATFIFSIIPVFVFIAVNIYFFKTHFKNISPAIKSFNPAALRDILSLGVKFFVIQISVLIFYQTTNLLISRYFSPELVTPYNIAYKYFGVVSMALGIISLPNWSAYTEAYAQNDIVWIRQNIKQMIKIWALFSLLALIMLFFSNFAYQLWVGEKVKVDFSLSFFIMLYVVVSSFGSIFIMFINGIGEVKLQMIVNVIGMIVFIPLSYLLGVKFKFGVNGIVISTIICSLYGPLIAPFQVRRILSKTPTTKRE